MMVLAKFIFISYAFSMLVLIISAANIEKIQLLKRGDEAEQSLSQPQIVKKAKRPYHKYNTPEERREGQRLADLRFRKKYTKAGKEEAMQKLTGEELLNYMDSFEKIRTKRKILASQAYQGRKARGILPTSNRDRIEQLTKLEIKKKQSELQGEELANFNSKVKKVKADKAAYNAKRYQKLRTEMLEKAREKRRKAKETQEETFSPVSQGSEVKRKYTETDMKAANQAALSQVPNAFRPHKQTKTDSSFSRYSQ